MLLEIKNLFFSHRSDQRLFQNFNLKVEEGKIIALAGESGCGKSTLARTIIGLVRANAGSIKFGDEEIVGASKKTMRIKRKDIQMIFQDPLASLNPRMTVGDIIAEPLRTYYPEMKKSDVQDEVRTIMKKVGLLSNQINRYPHEFSGGQCQRIGIQAQVINLLQDLQQEMGLSLIFIAHDLSVIKHIAHRVLVMYLGHAVELGTGEAVYGNPTHPYTQALMSAVPLPDPIAERNKTIQLLEGELPSPINPPSGCVFRTRCPIADSECAQTKPILEGALDHRVACLKNKVEMV